MDSVESTHLIREYAERVARARVYAAAIETPLDRASRLSDRTRNNVLLKREDLQPVFSFKCRGAENTIAHTPKRLLDAGVICSSAGNHAQGVALAARRRGLHAVIVMPENAPSIKMDAVRALGAEIILSGQTYDDAYSHAVRLAERQGLAFIHPFADPDVIAGQGTIALELERQWTATPTAVFVPVGGGGLISGIGTYLRQHYPDIKLIGVEPTDAASMHAALAAGKPVTLDRVGIFADGVAVRRVDAATMRICSAVVDEIILVDTDEICAAIKDIFEDFRIIAEPAGALAIAGLKRFVEGTGCESSDLIAILSGANMNFDRLRHISERAEIGEHREALIAVSIPERRGAFLEFCERLGTRNITEFNYRYAPSPMAHIFVGVTLTEGRREVEDLMGDLGGQGYEVIDLTENELAKLHIRHMIGGYTAEIVNESLYRFEFPERPGALLEFLRAVGVRWNISLFHYRNHGSDYGRVLAGVQVPPEDISDFVQHLETLGYAYRRETENDAYRLFLSAET